MSDLIFWMEGDCPSIKVLSLEKQLLLHGKLILYILENVGQVIKRYFSIQRLYL